MSTPPPDPQPPYGPGPYGSPGPQGYPQGHSQGYPGHPGPPAPQGYDPSQGYPPQQGYPPGPGYPPPGYPPPPGGGYGAPTPPPRSKTPLIVGSVLALLLIAAGAAYFLFPGDAEAAEVFLVPAASTGPDPFSENPFAPPPDPAIAQPAAEGSAPVESPPAGPVRVTSGATPGLYGGTQNRASCDPDQMVSFLAANPDKAQAWVNALTADPEVRLRDGRPLTPATIPEYVDGLTSLTLMADTRVTNHGFRNGRPTRLQSVLQKGSAVMVDEYGVPRVKCYCGNPLLPPAAPPAGRVRYEGPRWPDFDPNRTTVVGRPPTPVDTFIVRVPPNGELVEVPRGGVPGRPVPPEVFEDGEPGAPPPEAYVSSDPPQAFPDPPMADDPSPPASASSECSPEGTQPVTIEITNDMRETAAIFWVDENCNQQLYRRLAPGESYTQSTFAGHRWIANVEGMDHAQFRASPSSTSWVIQ